MPSKQHLAGCASCRAARRRISRAFERAGRSAGDCSVAFVRCSAARAHRRRTGAPGILGLDAIAAAGLCGHRARSDIRVAVVHASHDANACDCRRVSTVQVNKLSAESDFGMIRDLPVLENFDVDFQVRCAFRTSRGGVRSGTKGNKRNQVMKVRFQFGVMLAAGAGGALLCGPASRQKRRRRRSRKANLPAPAESGRVATADAERDASRRQS